VTAENRDVTALVANNGMPGLVFGIQKIKVVNRSTASGFRRRPVSLHAGDTAVLAAVAFFLIDNNSLHFGPLDF
jgi:hypothetical protein